MNISQFLFVIIIFPTTREGKRVVTTKSGSFVENIGFFNDFEETIEQFNSFEETIENFNDF